MPLTKVTINELQGQRTDIARDLRAQFLYIKLILESPEGKTASIILYIYRCLSICKRDPKVGSFMTKLQAEKDKIDD